jgi:hypothetical protein
MVTYSYTLLDGVTFGFGNVCANAKTGPDGLLTEKQIREVETFQISRNGWASCVVLNVIRVADEQ